MHCTQFTAFIAFLLVLGCQALTFHAELSGQSVYRRTSNPPSPSSAGGSPSRGPSHSSGLLGDVVAQGSRGSTPDPHSSSSVRVHPNPFVHSQSAHVSQMTQAHSSHQTPSVLVHPTHFVHPQFAHLDHAQGSSQGRGRMIDATRLKAIGASVRNTPGSSKPKRVGKWATGPNNNVEACAKARATRAANREKNPPVAWWNKVGGQPRRRPGESPRFEKSQRYQARKKEKELAAKGHPTDEHSSKHQPPHGGGGPGSPGAGSHAVSKRRLCP